MKQLLTITLLVIASIASSQNTATPLKIDNKDIYILMKNNLEASNTNTVILTKEQIANTKNINDRVHLITSNNQNFDALLTRDGKNFQLLKYTDKSKKATGKIMKISTKDIYFFSTPTKEFKVVSSKEMDQNLVHKSFIEIAQSYINSNSIIYDAIVISDKNIEYILYTE